MRYWLPLNRVARAKSVDDTKYDEDVEQHALWSRAGERSKKGEAILIKNEVKFMRIMRPCPNEVIASGRLGSKNTLLLA